MNQTTTITTLDYTPLTSSVSFQEKMKHPHTKSVKVLGVIGGVGFVVAFGLLRIVGLGDFPPFIMVMSIIMLIFAAVIFYNISRHARLQIFALQNNLTYQETLTYDNRSGIIFQQGHSHTFRSVLLSNTHAFSEIGNYSYNTGSGKNEKTHSYGYARIKLPRKLPNIVLDSTKK